MLSFILYHIFLTCMLSDIHRGGAAATPTPLLPLDEWKDLYLWRPSWSQKPKESFFFCYHLLLWKAHLFICLWNHVTCWVTYWTFLHLLAHKELIPIQPHEDPAAYDICQYRRLAMKQIPISEGPVQWGICNRTPTRRKHYWPAKVDFFVLWRRQLHLQYFYTLVNEPNEQLLICLCFSDVDTWGMKEFLWLLRRCTQVVHWSSIILNRYNHLRAELHHSLWYDGNL